MRRLAVLLAVALGAAPASGAALIAPSEITLYVHATLADTEFVERLVCELGRVLVAPVRAKKIALPLGPEPDGGPGALDVAKVGDAFMRAVVHDGAPGGFRFLLLPQRLTSRLSPDVTGQNFGNARWPFQIGVLSVGPLAGSDATSDGDRTQITESRVYKVMLQMIANGAGYPVPGGCVLAPASDVTAFDALPNTFCPADRAALVQAGILKDEETGVCQPTSRLEPASRGFDLVERPH